MNVIELAVYKREIKDIKFNIHVYDNNLNLNEYIKNNLEPGTVFFGPISTENTKELNQFCNDGVLFFSFSSDRSLANDCVFLINFFPYNEIKPYLIICPMIQMLLLFILKANMGIRLTRQCSFSK